MANECLTFEQFMWRELHWVGGFLPYYSDRIEIVQPNSLYPFDVSKETKDTPTDAAPVYTFLGYDVMVNPEASDEEQKHKDD